MSKSHLETKTRSSRPNPSRMKASTLLLQRQNPKQAAKRTIFDKKRNYLLHNLGV